MCHYVRSANLLIDKRDNSHSVHVPFIYFLFLFLFPADDSEVGIGICGWLLTAVSWAIVIVTLPFSLCVCFKVIQLFSITTLRLTKLKVCGFKPRKCIIRAGLGSRIFFLIGLVCRWKYIHGNLKNYIEKCSRRKSKSPEYKVEHNLYRVGTGSCA